MDILNLIIDKTSRQRFALFTLFKNKPDTFFSRRDILRKMQFSPYDDILSSELESNPFYVDDIDQDTVPTILIQRLKELLDSEIIEETKRNRELYYKLNRITDGRIEHIDFRKNNKGDIDVLEQLDRDLNKYNLPFNHSVSRILDKSKENIIDSNGISKKYTVVDFETPFIQNIDFLSLLNEIYYAIIERNPIKYLKYKGHYNSRLEPKTNTIKEFHPYVLKETKGQWYAVGKISDKDKFIHIALNRIINESSELDVDYDKQFDREDFNPETYWQGCAGITKLGSPITIQFLLKNGELYNNVNYVLDTPLIKGHQTIKKSENNWYEVKLKDIYVGPEIIRIIRSLGRNNIKDVKPKWLMEDLWEDGKRHNFNFSIKLPNTISIKDFIKLSKELLRINKENDNESAEIVVKESFNKKNSGWQNIELKNILINSVLFYYVEEVKTILGAGNYYTKSNSALI